MHCGLCVVFSLRANLIDSMRHSSDCVAYAIEWEAGLIMSQCMFRFISFNSPTLVRSKSLFIFLNICSINSVWEQLRLKYARQTLEHWLARQTREQSENWYAGIYRAANQSVSVLRDSAKGLLWIIRVHLGRLCIVWIRSCGKASHQITKYLNDCNLPPWILKNVAFSFCFIVHKICYEIANLHFSITKLWRCMEWDMCIIDLLIHDLEEKMTTLLTSYIR